MTTDHVAKTNEIAAEPQGAGLVTVTTREDGGMVLLLDADRG